METKTEVLTAPNGKSAEVKTTGRGSREKVFLAKLGDKEPEKAKEKVLKTEKEPKLPHVGADYKMPTLRQVARFVKAEALSGKTSLTATEIRKHFAVPAKIPMAGRMARLAKLGWGKLENVDGKNTLTLDAEAVKSGKAEEPKKHGR